MSLRRATIAAFLWALSLYGVLSLSYVPLESQSICGVWGCFPPLQALIAMHGFWLLLMLPPVVAAIRLLRPTQLLLLSVVLLAAALLAFAWIVMQQYSTWYAPRPSFRQYFAQRIAYCVATKVDVPIVQSAIAGVACLVSAVVRRAGRTSVSCQV